MLTVTVQPRCSICSLDRYSLPDWAHDLDTPVEQAPGDYRCATTEAPILPALSKLSPQENALLEHELQLFAWLNDRVSIGQRIEPLRTAADVIAAVERIDGWATATDAVIYKLRHWPLGRLLITAYGPAEGTRCY